MQGGVNAPNPTANVAAGKNRQYRTELEISIMAQPTAKVEKGNLIITVPLNPAEPSNSGKTMLVASQRFITEQPLVDGKNLTIQVNAYYKPTAG